ncbi:MAG: hypothetical protein LBL50_04070 [Candidatus Margulisbacteria bacterium]|nr:hypothetical protein [Candidatus Margulisiibacteriota bacterium]
MSFPKQRLERRLPRQFPLKIIKDAQIKLVNGNRSLLSPDVQRRLDRLIGIPPAFYRNGYLKNYGSGLSKSIINNEQKQALLDTFFNYDGTILAPLTTVEKDECYRQLVDKFPSITVLLNAIYKPQENEEN